MRNLKFTKKIGTYFFLILSLLAGTLFFFNGSAEAAKVERFIYIDKVNFKLTILEGEISDPARANVIFGPVDVAGPRPYFKENGCNTPGGKNCPNFLKNTVKDGTYSLTKNKSGLKYENNMPYSEPYSQFNRTGRLKMFYPLLIKGTHVSGINIHTYNPGTTFNPSNTQWDDWGNALPKGQYTHGCWALSFENASKVHELAFDGMKIIFASRPHAEYVPKRKADKTKLPKPTKTKSNPSYNAPLATHPTDLPQNTNRMNRCTYRGNDFKKYSVQPNDTFLSIFNKQYSSDIKMKDARYNELRNKIVRWNDLTEKSSQPQLWPNWDICIPK